MTIITVILASLFAQDEPATPPTLIIVVGAPGTAEFKDSFVEWADRWETAGTKANARVSRIGGALDGKTAREQLQARIDESPADSRLWIVLIGHGTFDRRTAKFNLTGPDVSAKELDGWLDKENVPTAVINCASASAPFINRLSGENRVVVSATKSGAEHNYARFGEYLSEVVGDPTVDLDKDGQTSLLEAWLIAARRTQDFYSENGRLASEHALIDDNGDERGTRYDAFRGIRPVQTGRNAGPVDGFRAQQWVLIKGELERRMSARSIAQRDEIELAIRELRENRSQIREDEYYQRLEELLVPLATLYDEIDSGE